MSALFISSQNDVVQLALGEFIRLKRKTQLCGKFITRANFKNLPSFKVLRDKVYEHFDRYRILVLA